jgi:hypothetical protein
MSGWNEEDDINYPPAPSLITETPVAPPAAPAAPAVAATRSLHNPLHDLSASPSAADDNIEAGIPESSLSTRIGRRFLREDELALNSKFIELALTSAAGKLNQNETIPRVDLWRKDGELGDYSLVDMQDIYMNATEFKASMDSGWDLLVGEFACALDNPETDRLSVIEQDEEVVQAAKDFIQQSFNSVISTKIAILTIETSFPCLFNWLNADMRKFLFIAYLCCWEFAILFNGFDAFYNENNVSSPIDGAIWVVCSVYVPLMLIIYVNRSSDFLRGFLREYAALKALIVSVSGFTILFCGLAIVACSVKIGTTYKNNKDDVTWDYLKPSVIRNSANILVMSAILILEIELGLLGSTFGRTDGSKFANLLQGGKSNSVRTTGKESGKFLTANSPSAVVETYSRVMAKVLRDNEFWNNLNLSDEKRTLKCLSTLTLGVIKKLVPVDRNMFLPLFKSLVVGELTRWFDHHTMVFESKSKAYDNSAPEFEDVAMYGFTAYWESIKLHFTMFDLLNLSFEDNWTPDSMVKVGDATGYVKDVTAYIKSLSVEHELNVHKGCPPFIRDLEKVLGVDAFKITYRVKSVESIKGKSSKTPKPIDDVFALTMVVEDRHYSSVVIRLFNATLTNKDAPYLCGYRVKISSKFEKDGKTRKYRDVKVHFIIGDEKTGEPLRFGAGYHACFEVKLLSSTQESSIVNGRFHDQYEVKRGYGK